VLLALPGNASAQRGVFIEGLLELATAADGTFGDEGPQLHAALDKMRAALERWNPPGRANEPSPAPVEWDPDSDDPARAYRALAAAARPDAVPSAFDVLIRAYRRIARGELPASRPFPSTGLLDARVAEGPVVPLAAYARGYQLLLEGAYSDALAELRRATRDDPLLTDPAVSLETMRSGVAALRDGRLQDAHRLILATLAAVPGSSEAHRVLGLVYRATSRPDESITALRASVDANAANERARLALARALIDSGRVAEAEPLLRSTIDAFPGSSLAHWWLGRVYENLARVPEARRHIELAAGTGVLAGRGALWRSIGRLARIERDFAASVRAFERVVEHDLNDARAHEDLARAYLEENRVDEAFRELVAACLIDPRDAEVHASVGRIHLIAGRDDDAALALGRAVALRPDLHEARYALATALTRLGRHDAAARELDTFERASRQALAARRQDMAVEVLIEEAALRASEGRLDEAIRRYEEAAAIGSPPDVYLRLADLYARVGRNDDSARARAAYGRLVPSSDRVAPR
jgi:tetratricopeptide (TPR) repeat protein